MAGQNILIDIDGMLASIDKIVGRLLEFPDEGTLNVSHGAGIGVAKDFRSELGRTARVLEATAGKIRADLQQTQEAIRATMNDMVEQDAALADDAQRMLTVVESVVPPTTPAGSGSPSAPSSGTPASTAGQPSDVGIK
jgi:hypothetical protein